MQATKLTADQIVDYLTEQYLKSPKGLTAREIAQGLNCSEARVRTVLNDVHYKTDKLSRTNGERQTYSKDYPMFSHGYCRVNLWAPSKEHLVEMINELRADLARSERPASDYCSELSSSIIPGLDK